jgi:hypothetical protein
MCHVIAFSPHGPRGSGEVAFAGRNRYDNLILLCPTHHTEVDRAPADYSVAQLLERKRQHEQRVEDRLSERRFESAREVMSAVLSLLNENHAAWKAVGPESDAAHNPLSNSTEWWRVRKTGTIIPNNSQILAWLDTHRDLFSSEEAAVIAEFREHALAFEQSTFSPLELAAQPRFPLAFRDLVERRAREHRPSVNVNDRHKQ